MAQLKKKLVVTADDYGYSSGRNTGIEKCLSFGAASQASCLMNTRFLRNSRLKAADYCLGLHLNLSEGMPVSQSHLVPSLVNHCGKFFGKTEFWAESARGNIKTEHVYTELTGQIQSFRDYFGQLPRYIDGHQHVHVVPGVRDVVAQVMIKHGVKYVRMPTQEHLGNCTWVDESRMTFYTEVVRQSEQAKAVFEKYNLRYSETFIGFGTMGTDMTKERLEQSMLDAFEKYNTVELMVHPGCTTDDFGGCADMCDPFQNSPDRANELNVLIDVKAGNFYQENHIELCSME